ncbi:hypothetical protein EDD18DRAFT_1328947 [Armillaria luteobubalina]|uniref:HIT-type domain-containing protein n=1 Tax=Armillaria luteobubalina TaxID=153913 RepID=A0AA39V0Q7_9AGAR|nr:hypothetical protein EDD18DRAFT_1328947 [Armillaria luteobubalina]
MSRSTRRLLCQICSSNESKYTCAGCRAQYCSVPCFKEHKASSCGTSVADSATENVTPLETLALPDPKTMSADVEEPRPLRSLSSLKWPYIPEQSAYLDPLQRDDPKPLQLRQYETIETQAQYITATSPTIRNVLSAHPNLPALLTSIDNLRGQNRDLALQRSLGVTDPQFVDRTHPVQLEEDVLALRALAEAVEDAVRGEQKDALGLNWGDD